MRAFFTRFFVLSALIGGAALLLPAPGRAQGGRLQPGQLQPDARLLRDALERLHPCLYRHVDSLEVTHRFAVLETQWAQPQTLATAYRDLTMLLAGLRDAATYANPRHQSKAVRGVLFDRATSLPFHFRLVDKRMFVTAATDSGALPRGTEITRINDVAVPVILDTLLAATRADGANDFNRFSRLEIRGDEPVETFDALYPLFYPVGRVFTLTVRTTEKAAPRSLTVAPLPASAREAELARRRPTNPRWRLDFPDRRTARLVFPDLAPSAAPKPDWKNWLAESFATIQAKHIDALILDVRAAADGPDEVVSELLRYLTPKPLPRLPQRRLWRFDQVPAGLLAFLEPSTPTLTTLSPADFQATSDGAYERLADRTARVPLRPYPTAFVGKNAYVLCGPRNSGGVFQLLQEIQTAHLATLVGQPTGGNRRGTSGGEFFRLRLPNTGLEVDVPLIAFSPLRAQPDEGLQPDDIVEPTVEVIRAGTDPDMARVRALLRDERTER